MHLLLSLKITLFFFIVATDNYAFAQNRVNELDHYFSTLSENGRFNGNVLIAERGKVIYERSFGYADVSTKKPHTALSSFPIASITKTVTATAILQLQEKGKLQITDGVTKYLPNFPYPNVTIRHLLSHTSGLPDYDELFLALLANHPDTVFTNKDLIPASIVGKLPLAFQPGAEFEYNNANFNVLALIVEKISGLPFGAYLHQYIFQPAGMTSTSLSDFFSRKDKHLSTLYWNRYFWSESLEKADTVIAFHRSLHNYNFMGHGDIISTARDLLKFDEALSNGRLLNEATLTAAFTPVKLANGNDNPQRYALGWVSVGDTLAGKVVMHTGGIPGVRSILFRNISRYQTAILLDNTSNDLYTYAENGLRILNGIKVAKPGKSAAKQYAMTLVNKGITAGVAALAQMEKDTVNYNVDEGELNILGYEFLANKMDTEALEVFKTNVRLFPASWNVYDSYGEVLLKTGKKEEAIRMYKKSVELNGGNENGKKVLEQLNQTDR
jgi:CubicO group peptidase (beta-lactamase class C family)